MRNLTDEQLDALLGEHFDRELASQEGRGMRHFLEMTQRRHAGWSRMARWSTGLVAGAAAACVAIVVMQGRIGGWFAARPGGQATSQPVPGAVAPTNASVSVPVRREQVVEWGTLDEGGGGNINGQPVRQLRQVELQRVRLLDASGRVVFETVIPRERVMFIDARTY